MSMTSVHLRHHGASLTIVGFVISAHVAGMYALSPVMGWLADPFRDALMQRVWGDETHITERSVDTLIKRLRRKIEPDAAEPRFILTVWGSGYKFTDG